MRANLTGKNLLRYTGLAIVFVLAFALVLGGAVAARDRGASNVAFADQTSTPGTTYLNITSGTPGTTGENFYWSDTFTYVPSTYTNFYRYFGGSSNMQGNLTSTSATVKTSRNLITGATGPELTLYAFYRLPDYFVDAGANISLSYTTNNTWSKIESGAVDSIALVSGVGSDVAYSTNSGPSTGTVTSSLRYIRYRVTARAQGSVFDASYTVQGLSITIKVNSTQKAPSVNAWNGTQNPNITYALGSLHSPEPATTNRVGTPNWFNATAGDSIVSTNHVYLTSLVNDPTINTKTFSYTIYDHYTGLRTATFGSLDLMSYYTGGGKGAYTYTRDNSTLPNGIRSVYVKAFGYANETAETNGTGLFRGLQVSVVYDGIRSDGVTAIEAQSVYQLRIVGVSGHITNVPFYLDGLDITPPIKYDIKNPNDFAIQQDGILRGDVTWFDVNNLSFYFFADEDARGDVDYTYNLFYSADGTGGSYNSIYTGTVQRYITAANLNTLPTLEVGYYYLSIVAKDTLGRDYFEQYPTHVVSTENYFFAVDIITVQDWLPSDAVTTGAGVYGGNWTNQNVNIAFNTIDTITQITYEYKFDGYRNGQRLNSLSQGWTAIDDPATVIYGENGLIIGEDLASMLHPASGTESWYSEFGYERVYSFRATLESGRYYEETVTVRFDNSASISPVSAYLQSHPQTSPYADLLPFTFDINCITGANQISEISALAGSPVTLNYSVVGEGTEGYSQVGSLAVINNQATIDFFRGRNVDAPVRLNISLWFTDEAGNTTENNPVVYEFYIDRAQLYVVFTSSASLVCRYDGTTTVPTGLISHKIYKSFDGTTYSNEVSSEELDAVYSLVFDGADAGARNILISDYTVNAIAAQYTAILGEYQINFIGSTTTDATTTYTQITDANNVVATHDITPARIILGWYMGATGSRVQYTNYGEAIYNGTVSYPISGLGAGTFTYYDAVSAEAWQQLNSDLLWGGTISLGNNSAYRHAADGKAISISPPTFILEVREGSTLNLNNYDVYQEGSPSSYIIGGTIDIKPKPVTIEASPMLSKTYDGRGEATIVATDYIIEGVYGVDTIRADFVWKGYTAADEASTWPNVGIYNLTYNVSLTGNYNNNYYIVDSTGAPLAEMTFEDVEVAPATLTVNIDSFSKYFDGTTALPTGLVYALNGVVNEDNVDVEITGAYTAANVGQYNLSLNVALTGELSKNYVIAETAAAQGTILRINVFNLRFNGIYALDSNGNYVYTDGANNIFVKRNGADGYIQYGTTGAGTNVSELPDGAKKLVLNYFFKGGSVTVNGQRIDLAENLVYSIDYLTAEMQPISVAVDESVAKNVPILLENLTINSDARVYTITVADDQNVFADDANLVLALGGNIIPCDITVFSFEDIAFDGNVYRGSEISADYTIIYNGGTVSLRPDSNSQSIVVKIEYRRQGSTSILKTETYISGSLAETEGSFDDAGTYVAAMTVTRGGMSYVLEQEFNITKADITLEVRAYESEIRYGADGSSSVQALVNSSLASQYGILNKITYQYASAQNFAANSLLSGFPRYRGAGNYYVRAVFAGDDNVNAATSAPVAFRIGSIAFGDVQNYLYILGDTINEIDVDSLISNIYGSNVHRYFDVVYIIPGYNSLNIDEPDRWTNPTYSLEIPQFVGTYGYKIVHRDLIVGGVYSFENVSRLVEGTQLAAAASYSGTIRIASRSLNSVDTIGVENNVGSISATEGTLPAVGEKTGTLRFYALNYAPDSIWGQNFNNGLNEQAEALGGTFTVVKAYDTSLMINSSSGNTAAPLEGTYLITLNADGIDEGAKLLRYVANADGTYSFQDVQYTRNDDGTVTFETKSLGWIILANPYTPPVDNTNMIIGLSSGGAVIAFLVAAILVVIKKRRLI